ncbi:MAG: hypothetical protein WAO28_02290 [Candidatus Microsaccharimonas sp.]
MVTPDTQIPGAERQAPATPPENSAEVELKFLIDPALLPPLPEELAVTIDQVYVAIGKNKSELRLRRIEDTSGNVSHTMNMKTGEGFVRDEPINERPIPEDLFDAYLEQHPDSDMLKKIRIDIPFGQYKISVDHYIDEANAGLIVAEVEFYGDSLEEKLQAAADFTPPEWFGRDVTKDPEFKNQALALKRRKLAEASVRRALGTSIVRSSN